ncbi:MAG: YdjY domain-containing protein [Planctomycetota bacterium]|nr:YdjY domain-containing protein [Planctomycetota bacterium]
MRVLLAAPGLAFACAAFAVSAMPATPSAAADASVPAVAQAPAADVSAKLREAFAAEGILLDAARGVASIPAEILVRGDLLEYLVVNPRGAVHESAYLTSISASRINAALLALGVEPGRNARWQRKDPPPTLEEMRDGAPAYDVTPPEGDGFYLYVAWKLDGETYFYRMEDLILDLRTGATMRRHRWVYLGSRMLKLRGDEGQEAFAADLEGNLVNIAFFEQGNTLLTGALPECIDQTIWQSNFWLLPERESPVELVFARERLLQCPVDVEARLREATRVAPRESR